MRFIFLSSSCILICITWDLLACTALQREPPVQPSRSGARSTAREGAEDDRGRHAEYRPAWDHLSGPLRLVQSARPGMAAVSVPRRGDPGYLAVPVRHGSLVDPAGGHRTPERPDGGAAPPLHAGATAGVLLRQPLGVTEQGIGCRSLSTSAAPSRPNRHRRIHCQGVPPYWLGMGASSGSHSSVRALTLSHLPAGSHIMGNTEIRQRPLTPHHAGCTLPLTREETPVVARCRRLQGSCLALRSRAPSS